MRDCITMYHIIRDTSYSRITTVVADGIVLTSRQGIRNHNNDQGGI